MKEKETEVVEIAEGILSGTVGVVEGSRRLSALRSSVTREDHDPDFLPFVGIDSESDHIPLGDVRRLWAPDALTKKDGELKSIEDHYRPFVEKACRRLTQRFR